MLAIFVFVNLHCDLTCTLAIGFFAGIPHPAVGLPMTQGAQLTLFRERFRKLGRNLHYVFMGAGSYISMFIVTGSIYLNISVSHAVEISLHLSLQPWWVHMQRGQYQTMLLVSKLGIRFTDCPGTLINAS